MSISAQAPPQVKTQVPANGLPAEAPAKDGSRITDHAIIDCDIHNAIQSPETIRKYLSPRWRKHHETYGVRNYSGSYYPRAVPNAARHDSWPPSGLPPGGDLAFMQAQLLDEWGFEYGILNCLSGGGGDRNLEFGAALASAINDWQMAEWIEPEPRLKASLIVPTEAGDLAAKEIERIGDHPGFVQVMFVARTSEPMGRRKYWPIYEAACRHNLPIGIHFGGAGGHPITGSGWPSHYIEDHGGMPQAFQPQVTSLVMEGVFERFPELKIVMIEGGFGWLPPLMWRLDRSWELMRDEVPDVKRPPSEYIRKHFWTTTQPVEEPERPEHFHQLLRQMDMDDRLMFATDYPHWDFDSPASAFPNDLDKDLRRDILAGNAKRLYNLA